MKTPDILAFVLAGGEGTRLHPLTAERSKPSVPFGGRRREVILGEGVELEDCIIFAQ